MAPPVLVLVGGGHAHVQVVRAQGAGGAASRARRVVLVSDSPLAVYSGLLPAVVAGLAPPPRAAVDLRALCAAHGVTFVHAAATRVDPVARRLHVLPHAAPLPCALPYDVLSLNVGSRTRPLPLSPPTPNPARAPAPAPDHPAVVHTRPIARLAAAVRAFERRLPPPPARPAAVLVVGAGAAGVELALALDARFAARARVTLVSRADAFAAHFGRGPALAVAAELRRRRVRLVLGRAALALDPHARRVALDDGAYEPFDLAVIATGPAPHPWLAAAPLPTDHDGWLLVDPTLRCPAFPKVFAAGDCASFGHRFGPGFPPKAGVYAVRQGPILAHNLAVALTGTGTMKHFVPQPSFLSLLSTGDGRAIGTKYGLVFKGNWVFRLKTFIDESWQDKFRIPPDKHANPQQHQHSPVFATFHGSPAEGAAILLAADDIRVTDSFEQQLMVLRRMDADHVFREHLLQHAAAAP